MKTIYIKAASVLLIFTFLFAGAWWIHLHYQRPLPTIDELYFQNIKPQGTSTYQEKKVPIHEPFRPREYIRIYPKQQEQEE